MVAEVTTEGATAPPATPAVDIGQTLMTIVAERTGYPTDMLDLDLDLEADLGVDSIKRIEILGELRLRIGLGAGAVVPVRIPDVRADICETERLRCARLVWHGSAA